MRSKTKRSVEYTDGQENDLISAFCDPADLLESKEN